MWLIGQQPILDRDERITAYELLFRSPGNDRANIIDPEAATATVILGTLSGFGVEQVLGEHQGFVNVDEQLLFDDALELLPRESIVLELLAALLPHGRGQDRPHSLAAGVDQTGNETAAATSGAPASRKGRDAGTVPGLPRPRVPPVPGLLLRPARDPQAPSDR